MSIQSSLNGRRTVLFYRFTSIRFWFYGETPKNKMLDENDGQTNERTIDRENERKRNEQPQRIFLTIISRTSLIVSCWSARPALKMKND